MDQLTTRGEKLEGDLGATTEARNAATADVQTALKEGLRLEQIIADLQVSCCFVVIVPCKAL